MKEQGCFFDLVTIRHSFGQDDPVMMKMGLGCDHGIEEGMMEQVVGSFQRQRYCSQTADGDRRYRHASNTVLTYLHWHHKKLAYLSLRDRRLSASGQSPPTSLCPSSTPSFPSFAIEGISLRGYGQILVPPTLTVFG